MSGRRAGRCVLMACAVWLAPAPASAQMSMGAFSGQATGHLGAAIGNDEAGSALSVGASVAVLESSGWGAEFDFGYANSGDEPGDGLDAQSYMVNVIGVWPKGNLRPFGVAGVGAIRARTCVAGCTTTEGWTDFGFSGGGGLQYQLSDTFGVRGDVRYFTALGDYPDPSRASLSYWRIAVGVTYLWVIAP
jgi:opacity protein-like surface antigen